LTPSSIAAETAANSGPSLKPSAPRHTIYLRINRRAKNSVLERVFHALQEEQITNKRITVLSRDSTSVKVHPDAAGALKKTGNRRWGNPGAD
jgi:hypothetical protein